MTRAVGLGVAYVVPEGCATYPTSRRCGKGSLNTYSVLFITIYSANGQVRVLYFEKGLVTVHRTRGWKAWLAWERSKSTRGPMADQSSNSTTWREVHGGAAPSYTKPIFERLQDL